MCFNCATWHNPQALGTPMLMAILGLTTAAFGCDTYSVYDIESSTWKATNGSLVATLNTSSPVSGPGVPGSNEILRVNLAVPAKACSGITILDMEVESTATDGANTFWPVGSSMQDLSISRTGGILIGKLKLGLITAVYGDYTLGYDTFTSSLAVAVGVTKVAVFKLDSTGASSVENDELGVTLQKITWTDGAETVTELVSIPGATLTF